MAAEAEQLRGSTRDWIAVLSVMLGAFLAILDIQITNASLANIEGAIGASSSEGSWISTAYLTAEIITIPLTGWLSVIVGYKRYVVGNTVLFLLASIACAQSTSLNQMIVFRAAQGFTGGILIPMAFSIQRNRLPPTQQAAGVALFGFIVTFAPTLGPTLGGWLTSQYSWQWLFYVNLLPGSVALLMMVASLDAGRARLGDLKHGDWWGIAMMAAGLASLTIVLEEGERWEWFDSDLVRELSCVAVLGIGGFVVRALLITRPLVNLRILKNKTLTCGLLMITVLGGASLGSTYLIPVYCAQIQRLSPLQIGIVVMWSGIPQLVLFPSIPWLMRRFDARLLVATGTIIFIVSCWINVSLTQDVGMTQLILPQLLRGFGQPLYAGPLNQMIVASVTREQMADASTMSSMLRNLGGSMCIAAVATITDRREQFHFSVLAERLSRDNLRMQERLEQLGGGGADDHRQSVALLAQMVRRQAAVLSYADTFALIGTVLAISLSALVFLRPAASTRTGS